MRPIVSAMNSPTYKLSKWLVKEFRKLPIQQPDLAVKNSVEFIEKIKDTELLEGEILVSFDVSSLFPSVPIPQTLSYLKDFLKSNNLNQEIINEFSRLTDICMKQNFFQFNNGFYVQREGTAMGNPLSPFIADLFMSVFETTIKTEYPDFPRVWIRYVDDVFAIFNTSNNDLEKFTDELNSRFSSIKFTVEKETEGKLPFLDTLVIRNNNKLEFDVFRKATDTFRYITSDSNHCKQHKMASLNFLVNRLLNFPLTKERYEQELKTIHYIAKCNGYDSKIVNKLVIK